MNANLWIELNEAQAEKISGGTPDLDKNYNQGVYIADTLLAGQYYAKNVSPSGPYLNLNQGLRGEIRYGDSDLQILGLVNSQLIVPEAKAET